MKIGNTTLVALSLEGNIKKIMEIYENGNHYGNDIFFQILQRNCMTANRVEYDTDCSGFFFSGDVERQNELLEYSTRLLTEFYLSGRIGGVRNSRLSSENIDGCIVQYCSSFMLPYLSGFSIGPDEKFRHLSDYLVTKKRLKSAEYIKVTFALWGEVYDDIVLV